MIIDLILDRKDGDEYKAKSFYNDKALCRYIIDNEYNVNICNYIMSVDWLIDDAEKYLDEVESERQVNEEPQEDLNDRHEEELSNVMKLA